MAPWKYTTNTGHLLIRKQYKSSNYKRGVGKEFRIRAEVERISGQYGIKPLVFRSSLSHSPFDVYIIDRKFEIMIQSKLSFLTAAEEADFLNSCRYLDRTDRFFGVHDKEGLWLYRSPFRMAVPFTIDYGDKYIGPFPSYTSLLTWVLVITDHHLKRAFIRQTQ